MLSVVAFRRLAFVTALFAYLQIALGGVVRVTGSGLGCPDWPLCHGRPYPPADVHSIIEYSHRAVGSVTGVLLVITVIAAWVVFWRRRPIVAWIATASLVAIGAEGVLGGIVVFNELASWLVLVHLGLAMIILGCLLATAIMSLPAAPSVSDRVAPVAAAATYVLLLTGSTVVASGADERCHSWPLCGNGLAFSFAGADAFTMLHRGAVLVLGALLVYALQAAIRRPRTRPVAIATLVVFALQVAVGAGAALTDAAFFNGLHVAIATLVWAGVLSLAMLSVARRDREPAASPVRTPKRSGMDVLRDYLSLLKLRVVLLLDATAVGVMVPAAHGHPRVISMLAVLAGGTFAAGGAHAVNCWFDRDIDAEMNRTRRRPLPSGRIPASHALALGVGLNVLAFAVLWAGANLLAASLALAGALVYVFVYTIWLKRSTPQNIVIGGAAGAMPPLVGWAAATGRLDLTALALFGVVFFWTPPHFWALAQLLKNDYAHAQVPMLPVVAGDSSTKRRSIVYAVLTAAVSVVPFFTGSAGAVYLAGAIVLGAGLVGMSILDLEAGGWTRRLWRYSMVYVAVLFAVFAASPFIS